MQATSELFGYLFRYLLFNTSYNYMEKTLRIYNEQNCRRLICSNGETYVLYFKNTDNTNKDEDTNENKINCYLTYEIYYKEFTTRAKLLTESSLIEGLITHMIANRVNKHINNFNGKIKIMSLNVFEINKLRYTIED